GLTANKTNQVKPNPLPEMVGGLGFWGGVCKGKKRGGRCKTTTKADVTATAKSAIIHALPNDLG
ncbi:hypothetical protein, partial [Moraxella lacunata]|uniref:hypothetical protein n=1 Tax=Moraxella lacunata TaxID=477 RepID=UPI0024AE2939